MIAIAAELLAACLGLGGLATPRTLHPIFVRVEGKKIKPAVVMRNNFEGGGAYKVCLILSLENTMSE